MMKIDHLRLRQKLSRVDQQPEQQQDGDATTKGDRKIVISSTIFHHQTNRLYVMALLLFIATAVFLFTLVGVIGPQSFYGAAVCNPQQQQQQYTVATMRRHISSFEIHPDMCEAVVGVAASHEVDGSSNSNKKTNPNDATTTTKNTREEGFDKIYERTVWGGARFDVADFYNNAEWPPRQRKAGSGEGSDLGYNTATSLRIINDVIERYQINSMLDLPCGDGNWIFDSPWTDPIPVYLGLDVAQYPVQLNQRRFAHHSNKQFRKWDGVACPLPRWRPLLHRHAADAAAAASSDAAAALSPPPPPLPDRPFELVHARDVLQHLPLQAGVAFLCNVFTSGARFLITTTYPKAPANRNIATAGFFQNNLFLEPFNLPKTAPLYCNETHPKHEKDVTCVFELTSTTMVGEEEKEGQHHQQLRQQHRDEDTSNGNHVNANRHTRSEWVQTYIREKCTNTTSTSKA